MWHMNNTAIWGYAIAVLEVIFAGIGWVTGWINPTEALTLFSVGISTLGIHGHNVAVGRALQAHAGTY